MRLLLLAFCISLSFVAWGQGTTSSQMRGNVVGPDGEALIGASVVAIHLPSGTTFGTATNLDGQYQLPGMKVGGPYTVTVNYTGYTESSLENVTLRLGETYRSDFSLKEANVQLDLVTVIASAGVTGQTSGTSTQISAEQINNVPSLNRDLDDFLKLSPQSKGYSDGTSFAGVNNRFNAIYIDGAVNNDVYGLASSGTNGGQTGISPFSMDIIDQFQIVLSPYDVSLGGFAGGGVNAVTKSGTNQLSGTAYYFIQNEGLAGKTNGTLASRLGLEDDQRTKLDEFSKKVYGASLGGAIKKDKLFFFTNVEIQDDVTPIPFELGTYTATAGRAGAAELDALRNSLISNYGYDPGGYLSTSDELKGLKIFGKLDYNLSDKHRLTLRHQYTKGEQYDRFGGNANTIQFSNNGVFFPSITNSSALEIQSRFGQKTSNSLILGYTTVKDDRDPLEADFPYIFIEDGSGLIRIGSDEFSTANFLEQKTFSLTDNFKIYNGDHTFTIGTHNEFYSFTNVFIGQNFGTYRFGSLADFNAGIVKEYDRSYSLVDEVTGDDTKAAAIFNAMQIGVYVQDQWEVSPKFTLTGGIRVDLPVISTDPDIDANFNSVTLPKLQAAWPEAEGVEGGKAPDGQIMFSPRVGFEYDFNGDRKTILRGGAGIFTSRVPFVWPGAMFTNNGLTVGRVDEGNLDTVIFRSDVNNQYTNPGFTVPQGQVDLFTKDFKYPQVFRANLAIDQKFGNGFELSLEGLFTKTINNVAYTNINDDPTVKFNWTGSPDTRTVYFRKNLDNTYGGSVYLASNTNEGYGYNLAATLAKTFGSTFSAYVAYAYGDSKALSEGTSSQNSSQWRGQVSIDGRNHASYGRSDFAAGHHIITSFTYNKMWSKGIKTAVSLLYNGASGDAFSYVIGGSNGRNPNNETGSTSRNRSLVYVPATQSDINLVDYTAGGVTVTAATQWTNLNAFIEADKGLRESRGGYAEKNGSWAPFTSFFDLVVRQDFGADLGGDLHKVQFSLDIFNVANLLNKDWGVSYSVIGDFNNYFLYQFDGYDAVETSKPKFTYRLGDKTGKDAFDINGVGSRWRMRLGVRYIFN